MLRTENKNDVLHVTGMDRLTATNSAHFKELVKAQLGDRLRFVDVDCTNVKFMDSDGLGALVSMHKVVTPRGGKIRLTRVQPTVRQLLEILKFNELFEIA